MPPEAAIVLSLALLAELAVGDPVSPLHPVALLGRLIAKLVVLAPNRGDVIRLLYGAAMVLGVGVGVAFVSTLILDILDGISPPVAIIAGALLLKVSMSYRQLDRETLTVADEIAAGDLIGARNTLRALVSRDTESLPSSLLTSSAIESLAENLSDSWVGPLFYFALFGVPGAVAYRAINTLDAMIGYRGQFEHLGKVAARLDDLVNLIPARLTALLLVSAAIVARAHPGRAASHAFRDHKRTESPNAGWPMAAMAGALGVQLEKVGHYRLGDPQAERTPSTIRRGIHIARWTAALAATFALVAVTVLSISADVIVPLLQQH
ncbi:MAG: cobD-2 [Chloroflexi bacterium]|nr:cobD-2 [Chloroflexota bacterium]